MGRQSQHGLSKEALVDAFGEAIQPVIDEMQKEAHRNSTRYGIVKSKLRQANERIDCLTDRVDYLDDNTSSGYTVEHVVRETY